MLRSIVRRLLQASGLLDPVRRLRRRWRPAGAVTENWMSGVLQLVFRECEGAILDVGANTGQTLVRARRLDGSRVYIGFEPNPACVVRLHEVIARHQFRNCSIVPVGLDTQDRVVTLSLYSDTPTDSAASVVPDFRPQKPVLGRQFVPVFQWATLAPVLACAKVGVIKVDVEGAELEVLQTLGETIRRDRPVVIAEILPCYTADNLARVARQDEIERLLRGLGYVILRIGKAKDRFAGLRHLDRFGIHGDLDLCDYVFAPRELAQRLGAAVG